MPLTPATLPAHMRPSITEDQAVVLALRVLHTDATNESLARELGCGISTVQRHVSRWATKAELREAGARKMAAKRNAPGFNPKPPKPRFDWSGVDWTRNNTAIARDMGCAAQSVANARARLGKSASAWKYRPERVVMALGVRQSDRTRAEMSIVRRIMETNTTVRQVANEYGCSDGTIYEILCRYTTAEQRAEVRARKIAAKKRKDVSGFIVTTRARMVRRQTDPKSEGMAKAMECSGCGAELPPATAQCPKCGGGVVQVSHMRRVEVKPQRKKSGRDRVAAFLRELEQVA